VCGIAGWVSVDPVDRASFERALSRLAARGPDGSGVWANSTGTALLGHRRLAILDTSPRGAQPFVEAGGRSAFVHNGEIYNYRRLRAGLADAGEQFVSTSDGEVAHRLLRKDWRAALPKLDGMFALGWWDDAAGRLLLARDRIGIKPLYYARVGSGLAFASEPKALLALPEVAARLDPEALSDFLSYGYVPFDRCLFAGFRKLPAGHWLTFSPGSGMLETGRWWLLERRQVSAEPDELRARLDVAVESHLVSDVPVGAFLSGGLDSSTVVARASRAVPDMPTFTVGYRDGSQSDVEYARIAAMAFNTEHHEEQLSVGELSAALGRAAETYCEPLYDSTALAVLDLARTARRRVKVVLTGDGGDEVFGGYGWHETVMKYEGWRARLAAVKPLLDAVARGVAPIARTTRGGRAAGTARVLASDFPTRYYAVRGFFSAAEQGRVLGRKPEDPAWLFRQFDRPDLPLPHRLLWLDLHTYLPDNNLTLVDRSTMAVGLEARVPLLDTRLVEHAFSLPPEKIVRPGSTKIAFREAIAQWLPASILKRSKAGFSPPFKRWVGGANRDAALKALETSALAKDGIIRSSEVKALVRSGAQRRHNKIWLLLNLEAWYRRWIRGVAAPEPAPADAAAESMRNELRTVPE
jgi:asparagine synthase (glutamine-hydrolysing)